MTLVLPATSFCSDQLVNSTLFAGSVNNLDDNMPCVFDSEPLDFESALMTDWSSGINVYDSSPGEESMRPPSSSIEKRKGEPGFCAEPKKLRVEASSAPAPAYHHPPPLSHKPTLPPSPLAARHPPMVSLSSKVQGEEMEEEEEDDDDDDELITRRRAVPQMWTSRQKWKEERKKVLKTSVTKLTEIEDPELWLLRSVLINNTIKKLHLDIRNERMAKRQHRMDLFSERLLPQPEVPSSFEDAHEEEEEEERRQQRKDDDEMFGVSEDFLRVSIPDRRVSSPRPDEPDGDSSYYRCRTNEPRRHLGSTQCATQFRTTSREEGSFPPRVPILDSVVYHSLLASLESS